MNIRDATPRDKATLLEFIAAIQDAECAVHDSRLPGKQVAEKYYQRLLDHRAFILLAEMEDRAVGFVAGWPELDDDEMQKIEWRRVGLISDIYITSEFQGKGAAQQLLQVMSVEGGPNPGHSNAQ
jgi:GNAT superfamily N-acetyltransferase